MGRLPDSLLVGVFWESSWSLLGVFLESSWSLLGVQYAIHGRVHSFLPNSHLSLARRHFYCIFSRKTENGARRPRLRPSKNGEFYRHVVSSGLISVYYLDWVCLHSTPLIPPSTSPHAPVRHLFGHSQSLPHTRSTDAELAITFKSPAMRLARLTDIAERTHLFHSP